MSDTTCRCGCDQPGSWIVVGVEYHSRGLGSSYNEPACDTAARYLESAAAELGLPFSKTPLDLTP